MKITPRQSLSALNKDNPDPSLINRIMRKTNSSNLPSIHAGAPQEPYGGAVAKTPGKTLSSQYLGYVSDLNQFTIEGRLPIRLDYVDRPILSTPKARPFAASIPEASIPRKRKPESQDEEASTPTVTISESISSDTDSNVQSRVKCPF